MTNQRPTLAHYQPLQFAWSSNLLSWSAPSSALSLLNFPTTSKLSQLSQFSLTTLFQLTLYPLYWLFLAASPSLYQPSLSSLLARFVFLQPALLGSIPPPHVPTFISKLFPSAAKLLVTREDLSNLSLITFSSLSIIQGRSSYA